MEPDKAEITELTEKELESISGGDYVTIYYLGPDGKLIIERKKV